MESPSYGCCTLNEGNICMAIAPRHFKRLTQIALAGTALAALPVAAQAQVGSYRYSSIVVDNASGKVTEAVNADALRYPASLTKLMTLYMTFEAIRQHRIDLNQTVPVSEHAASMEPSKLGLRPGTDITVEQAILAIVTKSANDAACALGELVGGNEDRFAQMMTLRARALGMSHSTFRNASGLPNPEQTTTARDLAVLAHHLVTDYPEYYHYFSVPSFMFHGREIPNHDHMLTDYAGADGLKTGYTVAAGHNLVTSAVRGGVRLIGVVMGAASNPERDIHMASLLDEGFGDMGVPVTPRAQRHFQVPALIASADAETLHPRYAAMHGHYHLVHGHMVRLASASHRVAEADGPHASFAVARGHNLASTAHARSLASTASAGCKLHSKHHHCATYASRETRGT
jgi:D-alanyl-D-alanine carboxypeptidase